MFPRLRNTCGTLNFIGAQFESYVALSAEHFDTPLRTVNRRKRFRWFASNRAQISSSFSSEYNVYVFIFVCRSKLFHFYGHRSVIRQGCERIFLLQNPRRHFLRDTQVRNAPQTHCAFHNRSETRLKAERNKRRQTHTRTCLFHLLLSAVNKPTHSKLLFFPDGARIKALGTTRRVKSCVIPKS